MDLHSRDAERVVHAVGYEGLATSYCFTTGSNDVTRCIIMHAMNDVTEIVFETHSITEDNERGIATGWLGGRLSPRGRDLARGLGARRRDGIAAVFTSDLARAVETATIAFADTNVPILRDWRLRECDYGDLNGAPATTVLADRRAHLDTPYPNGESWREAVARVTTFVDAFPRRYATERVLVIGHVATRWALDCALDGRTLDDLIDEDFAWQPGWEYRLLPGPNSA